MKYEAFSYEEFLKGRKVFTRNGFEVTQLTKFKTEYEEYCLYGVVDGEVENWTKSGCYKGNEIDPNDLVLAKEENKRYLIISEASGFENFDEAISRAGGLAKVIVEVTDCETFKIVHTFNK